MRVKISNKALERVAKKIRGQNTKTAEWDEDVIFDYADNIVGYILNTLDDEVSDEDIQPILSQISQLLQGNIRAKRAQAPKWNDEEDETFEQDEAHQEFMRGEGDYGKQLSKVIREFRDDNESMAAEIIRLREQLSS